MRAGTSVQFGDQVAGRGDHDRVQPRRPVRGPSGEGIGGGGGQVADMHATLIQVKVERDRVTLTEEE